MSEKIILDRYYHPDRLDNKHSWPLSITAKGEGISGAIFVYQIPGINDPYDSVIFNKVASVNDLYEIPELDVVKLDEEFQIPFFRTATLNIICRNAEEADNVWEDVVEHTKDLIRNYKASKSLVSGVSATVTESGVSFENQDSSLTQLSFHPAGVAVVDNGIQNISQPDLDIRGWLPISEISNFDFTDPIPPGAKFFYNIDKHSEVRDVFPIRQPYSDHRLTYNGVEIPYGTVYRVTGDTIYWMDFQPDEFSFFNSGTAPWSMDYISPEFPGETQPEIWYLTFT